MPPSLMPLPHDSSSPSSTPPPAPAHTRPRRRRRHSPPASFPFFLLPLLLLLFLHIAVGAFLPPSSTPSIHTSRIIQAAEGKGGSSKGGRRQAITARNATDPQLLDLVGFRAGLEETYRQKRHSAVTAAGGGEGGGGGDRKPWGYWKVPSYTYLYSVDQLPTTDGS